MVTLTELLGRMAPDRFEELLAASPKKFREEIFRRAGSKKKTSAFSLKTTASDAQRIGKVQEAIRGGSALDAEHIEEIVRNYLYGRRTLLADALDFLGVEHDQGLTETDLDFVGGMPEEKGRALKAALEAKHPTQDVELYLSFMGIPGT
ncbi:MAG: hypothetical protein IPK13_05755 [Deltaproteobacteria bacterium]|nr:hypothetical protein [Deltaproteobacteria bacterium]